jgi:hypothetical protein
MFGSTTFTYTVIPLQPFSLIGLLAYCMLRVVDLSSIGTDQLQKEVTTHEFLCELPSGV